MKATYDEPALNARSLRSDKAFPIVFLGDLTFRPSVLPQKCSACFVCWNDDQAEALAQLWTTLETVPFGPSSKEGEMIFYEKLSRKGKLGSKGDGYDYVHYPPIDEEHGDNIRGKVGRQGIQKLQQAYQFLPDIGQKFSVAACQQSLSTHA